MKSVTENYSKWPLRLLSSEQPNDLDFVMVCMTLSEYRTKNFHHEMF